MNVTCMSLIITIGMVCNSYKRHKLASVGPETNYCPDIPGTKSAKLDAKKPIEGQFAEPTWISLLFLHQVTDTL